MLQHLVAHGGNTRPSLFHQAVTSSTFLPSQYNFDDPIPEVGDTRLFFSFVFADDLFLLIKKLYSDFVEMTG